MQHKPAFLLGFALLCSSTLLQASSVLRCEDATGNITFTTLGCPSGQDMQRQEAYNPPPGSVTPLLPGALEQTERPGRKSAQSTQAKPAQSSEVVIVGQRDDGCGNRLSPEQRRRALINQQTPPGMTRKDVESLLGRPDKIVSRNGETRYVYQEKKGRSSQVTFDEHDCVKGKR
ncbi:outer membrane protein assembly factor BamE domain-containing protein [Pseudomonas folii]|uniref:Outer membrane protein assembly factor BamE n=1 Tax=Pseudomonas folii TaxID=2762593 RepID=A0ABR7B621_9PSED|nr:outer membrane protein assembly factor BamE [Pseudomonas folii]MBC3952589.1 outer membrane protein assembly factor BamE [Pseudomonas folii]